MRMIERIGGLLAGVFGVVALLFVLTQRTEPLHIGWTSYAPLTSQSPQVQGWQVALFVSLACVVVGAACSVLGAWRDAASGAVRSPWPVMLIAGVVLSVVGIWLASVNSLWIDLGVPASTTTFIAPSNQISLGTVYFPVAVFAVAALALAFIRHAPRPARA